MTHNTYGLTTDPDMPIQLKEDHDIPFVEWVNEADMTVEAVFCGHTHQDHIYHSVTINNMNSDQIQQLSSPTGSRTLYYTETSCYYIETNTACKGYP
jgi:mRNA degradation ribonuclease J1/J2